MKRFKNILIVVSDKGSEKEHPKNNPAIARGVALAKKNNARLTLMDVISPPERAISEYKGIIKPEELTQMLVTQREKALGKMAEQLGNNIDVNVKVATGRDFIEIVRQVILEKQDLLIKVANDHPDSFDSSDFHLMRKCPQPVWLLKPKDQGKSQKVLAAVDLGLESYEEGRALNTLIMDLATSLAKWENSELHALSCWSLYGENALRNSAFLNMSEDKLVTLLHKEEQANRDRLDALTARYEGHEIHTHLIKGDPVDCIPAFARKKGIEIVVMGTVARSGIPGLLIGNTAETILHLIDSSVITLKPSGFESPIK